MPTRGSTPVPSRLARWIPVKRSVQYILPAATSSRDLVGMRVIHVAGKLINFVV